MVVVHQCKCSSSVILNRSIPLSVFHLQQAPDHANNGNHQLVLCQTAVCVRDRERERSGKAQVPHISCQTLPSLLTAKNSIKIQGTRWQHSNGLLHQSLPAALWRSWREKYRNLWRKRQTFLSRSFSLSVSSSRPAPFSWFLKLLWEYCSSISLFFFSITHHPQVFFVTVIMLFLDSVAIKCHFPPDTQKAPVSVLCCESLSYENVGKRIYVALQLTDI